MKNAMERFESRLTPAELELLRTLDSPIAIQGFLNTISYSVDPFYRCPLRVLRERIGHCFDGALFAAAALRRIGYPPLILEIIPNAYDDDHLLAVFKFRGHWGAVGQSNFSTLRYRDPVFRSLRELVMSYFPFYFNVRGEITMLGYRKPIDFAVHDKLDWMTSDANLDFVADDMERYTTYRVVSDEMLPYIAPADERTLASALVGVNLDGLFKLD